MYDCAPVDPGKLNINCVPAGQEPCLAGQGVCSEPAHQHGKAASYCREVFDPINKAKVGCPLLMAQGRMDILLAEITIANRGCQVTYTAILEEEQTASKFATASIRALPRFAQKHNYVQLLMY